MKKLNIVLSAILLITFSMVIILFFTRVQGKTPHFFDYQILRIASSSMEPKLQVGDVILSKKVRNITTLETGDIITYKGEVGGYSDKTITHEVTRVPYESNGKFYLQTMGIANTYSDPEISEDQVIGRMVCKLPVLSKVYNFFLTPWGLAVVLGFLSIMFINEVLVLRRLIKGNGNKDSDYLCEDSVENASQTTDSTDHQE